MTPQDAAQAKTPATPQATPDRQPWPAPLPEQMASVAHFTGKGKWKSALPEILATLEALGRARQVEAGWWVG